MTPCARGCCWTPHACARQRLCACHAQDTPRNEPRGSDSPSHSDPTANTAVRNIMNSQRRRKK